MPDFKYKRNKVRYVLNANVLGKIEAALDASDGEDRSGALDEGRQMLIERNKHIKLLIVPSQRRGLLILRWESHPPLCVGLAWTFDFLDWGGDRGWTGD